MDVNPRAAIARYFSYFFGGCAALIALITLSEIEFSIGTILLLILFGAYGFMLPIKQKSRQQHLVLAIVALAITTGMAVVLVVVPDMLSKITTGFALLSLALSYGMNVGDNLRSYTLDQDNDIDYQSLINTVRTDKLLMQTALHDTMNQIIIQIGRQETEKLFGQGKPDSPDNIKWELLAQAVTESLVDGYVIKILELQRDDVRITKPVMSSAEIMLPLWRTCTLKQAKKPSSVFLKAAIKQLASHKVRQEQRKLALASISAYKRTLLTGSETALIQLGYKLAEFEHQYRTEAGKLEIEQIETSIEHDFFALIKLCEKLPLALDGTQARRLLMNPDNFRFDSRMVHLACTGTDADKVVTALEEQGVVANVFYTDDMAVRRYHLESEAFTAIEPYIEVYLKDEDTGMYDATDISSEQLFAGLDKFCTVQFNKQKIKTLPPSFFIQQIIYCWADFPESKEVAWIDDYNTLCKKYFANKPIAQNPLFKYALSYEKQTQKPSFKFKA